MAGIWEQVGRHDTGKVGEVAKNSHLFPNEAHLEGPRKTARLQPMKAAAGGW